MGFRSAAFLQEGDRRLNDRPAQDMPFLSGSVFYTMFPHPEVRRSTPETVS